MSKSVKKVASIALPIVAGAILGPAGFGLTSTAMGSAIGGAAGGFMSGGDLKSAALGAATGYAASGLANAVGGQAAGATLAETTGNAALQGPTMGSGVMGAVTGGGTRALANTVTQVGSNIAGKTAEDTVSKGLLAMGNQVMAQGNAEAVEEATGQQLMALDESKKVLAPYTAMGKQAVNEINTINDDRAGYIQNDPFYQTLAKDAEQRLLANQAARGKVGSGGTAADLQDRLLSLGDNLVNRRIGELSGIAGQGYNAASGVSNIEASKGQVAGAGTIGQNNAIVGGYENQIDTILALQNVRKGTPTYSPTPISL